MKINRDEAHRHLQAGRPVAFRSGPGPGTTITPTIGKRAVQSLPPEDAEGDYFLLRDESGNLTRAGMEQALREGGAVMYHGEVIETANDLPDEVELVRGNERARKTLAESLDAQLAALAAQRARLDAPDKPDEETPALKQAKQSQEQRAAEEEQARREREQGQSDVRPEHERDRRREAMMASAVSPQHEQAILAEAADRGGEQPPGQSQTNAERERAAQEQAQAAQRQRQEQEARQQAEAEQAAREQEQHQRRGRKGHGEQ